MRKDRAVKITRKEVNALMQELFEVTELPSSDEEDVNQTTESLAALVSSQLGSSFGMKSPTQNFCTLQLSISFLNCEGGNHNTGPSLQTMNDGD